MNNQTKSSIQKTYVSILTGILLIGLASCRDNSTDTGSEEFEIRVESTQSHGKVLTDGDGMVLYFFAPDVNGESHCIGNCLANWPVLDAEQVKPQDGLEASDFSTIQRADGTVQTTYKGWPLYYFAGDQQPGEINGDGVNNAWYVASPEYAITIASGQLVGNDGKNYKSDYTEGEGTTTFFTDIEGRTLYTFKKDSANTNNYTNPDFSNNDAWPIFYTEIKNLPNGLNQQDFGEINVYGKKQLTYKGWPVYYFGNDTQRGDTKGVSVPSPGIWPIINSEISPAPK